MTIDHIAVRPGDEDYITMSRTYAGTGTPTVVLRPTIGTLVSDDVTRKP